jgi:benzoyl-CoA reductase/2-hydroxyglutaryl-CoA dehydratase subunit BcrC/BadD/HgdB
MPNSAAPIAGFTSNTVPWEILRAAGFAPRLLAGDADPTPLADRYMEDVFERRIRVLFDRIASGAWNYLSVAVIPRTSEQEHKLYLYLREFERMQPSAGMPKVYLYNLLHTRSPESYEYGLERTRQLARDMEVRGDDELRAAIAESNGARASIRKLLELRERGLVEGSEALRLIRPFYLADRRQFSLSLETQLAEIARRNPRTGPRMLIKGMPLEQDDLHRAVESAGGFVIAEDDWRGSRSAGDRDITSTGDPLVAVFDKYYFDTPSPRLFPPVEADAWFEAQVSQGKVDGVIFYLPPEDDVAGWDYPRHCAFLRSRGIPSLLIRETIAKGVSEEVHRVLQDYFRAFGSNS